jgi:hypothetical protein
MPPVRVDTREQDELQSFDHAADVGGRETLPAIAQSGAASMRLEHIGRQVDESIGRHPFARMQATCEGNGVGAFCIRRADPQRVRLPAFRGAVG